MRARQIIFTVLCVYLACKHAAAVVNNSKQQKLDDSKKTLTSAPPEVTENNSSSSPPPPSKPQDSIPEANGRNDTIVPPAGRGKLPSPIRRKYSSSGYNSLHGQQFYTPHFSKYPPKPKYGPPKPIYGAPFPKPLYGAPPPKPVYGVPQFKPPLQPKPIYGPPPTSAGIWLTDAYAAPQFPSGLQTSLDINTISNGGGLTLELGPVPPKVEYGVPFSSPSGIRVFPETQYNLPQALVATPLDINPTSYKFPKPVYRVPSAGATLPSSGSGLYGAPSANVGLYAPSASGAGFWLSNYGPPQPSPNPRPPHPGVDAPPTPPDIKYDGWQPIPGLVSRPPDDHGIHANNAGHHIAVEELVPPPAIDGGVSDSYGAPLSTVTGAGGVVASSGEEVHALSGGSSSIEGLVPPVRHPVQHREPVPQNVFANIEAASLGAGNHGPTYLPPPVLDLPPAPPRAPLSYKTMTLGSSGSQGPGYLPPLAFNLPPPPSQAPLSYNSVALGSATAGLTLPSSYGVPLGAVDGAYGVQSPPGLTVNLDVHPPLTIDLSTGSSSRSNSVALPCDLASSSSETKSKVASLAEEEISHGKSYGESVAASFGEGGELVQAQSIDLNNINLKGNLGSYTLQIQPAGGEAQGKGMPVPHAQVLNEELLQSILAAIEQPKPVENGLQAGITPSEELQLIDDNGFALYFNNKHAQKIQDRSESTEKEKSEEKTESD